MAFTNNSPNMNLAIPQVGIEPGPQYAVDVNNCLTIIDGHNHTPGSGVAVPPSGLNINSDLSFQDNNLTFARSVRFQIQPAVLSGATDLGCLYEVGVDLYYNDGLGNQIRITQSGGVVGSPGSISGLTSPASATYVSGDQTFVWQSAANTPANMDAGSVIFRNISANSHGVTVSAPAALGADYNLTLPLQPAFTSFVTIDPSGNLAPFSASAPGASGNVLTSNGTVFASAPPVGNVYWNGFTQSPAYWSTTSLSYTDPTNTNGNPITQRVGNGITVTAAGSNLPGITFTPDLATSVYLVSVSSLLRNDNAGGSAAVLVTDGTNELGRLAMQETSGGSSIVPFTITNVYAPATTSPVTLKIQMKEPTNSGTAFLGDDTLSIGNSINWSIVKIR